MMKAGGPTQHEESDTRKVHEKLGIGHMEFDAGWENMKKALQDHKLDSKVIKEMHDMFYSEQTNVITKN